MQALTWQGKRDVRVAEVPDPVLEEPTDAIVRVMSTAICGSDLHLYEVLGAYLSPGDILGHEEGAALFGYTSLYKSVVDLTDVVERGGSDSSDGVASALFDLTSGRGADAVIDAVGLEAHGSPGAKAAQTAVGMLPDVLAKPLIDRFAVDRLNALNTAIKATRRGGTVSVSGVYGGEVDPMPMMEMFDRGLQLRMGQCHVHRWSDDILPLVLDDTDPLGVGQLATHVLPLRDAPEAYAMFQAKTDGCLKVVLKP